MSFRTRLTLFFVLIVVVPMVALGVVVTRLVTDSEEGKADARAGAHVTAAMNLYRRAAERGAHAAQVLGTDPALGAAIRRGARADAHLRLDALRRQLGTSRVRIVRTGADEGRPFADVGDPTAIAAGSARVRKEGGPVLGARSGSREGEPDARAASADSAPAANIRQATLATVEASVITAAQYVDLATAPGVEMAIHRGDDLLATSLPDRTDAVDLPARGDVTRNGTDYVAAGFTAADFGARRDTIAVLADAGDAAAGAARDRRVAFGLLAGFLLLALCGALLVSRQLQAQIGRFLVAAKRIGGGDFSTAVPADGADEFAALGREFNNMSGQLEQRIGDLNRERERLRSSIQRIGDTFAANLDRTALLQIGVQTAVDAVEATCGRALVGPGGADPGGAPTEQACVGEPTDAELVVLRAAEARALATGAPASVTSGGSCALAAPIPRTRAAGGTAPRLVAVDQTGPQPHGLVSVARDAGCPVTAEERGLLASLAAQTGISLENVELHDRVTRQAVTDELTGLFNHRRFQEVVTAEIAASHRYDRPLGLLMIDIDDFKRVNDTYGHQQGDLVLRQVARVLRDTSREIDEPARYGGEEMAVALPQTDLDGAYAIAERVRTAVEALRIPRLDGAAPLCVTVSCGVAATAGAATVPDKDALIAAADAALYRAKHSGKNRTVRAAPDAVAPA